MKQVLCVFIATSVSEENTPKYQASRKLCPRGPLPQRLPSTSKAESSRQSRKGLGVQRAGGERVGI